MARVKHQKARKDYPGIPKGSMYYYAKIKTGPRSSRVIRQLAPIRRSQLTSSSFLSQLYDLQDITQPALKEPGDFEAMAEEVRALGEEAQGSFDNMPEGLQQGDTGQLLEERAQAMEAWADSLEECGQKLQERLDEIEALRAEWAAYDEALEAWEAQGDDKEADEEPEAPSEDRPEDEAEEEALQEALDEIEEPSC